MLQLSLGDMIIKNKGRNPEGQTKTKYNFLYLWKKAHPEILQVHVIFPIFTLKLWIEIYNPEYNTLLYMQQSVPKIAIL